MTGYETLLLLAIIGAGGIIVLALLLARARKRRWEREMEASPQRVSPSASREDAPAEPRWQMRTLDGRELRHYRSRWDAIQQRFIDSPVSAVREAQALVVSLMTARGYPDANMETRLRDLSEHHPQLVEHFQKASVIARAARLSQASTEDLRKATIHYRVLFDELLEGPLEADVVEHPTEAPSY